MTTHSEFDSSPRPADPRNGPNVPDGVNDLRTDIAHVLNCYSAENESNTPDFILAEFLTSCLAAFDEGVRQREAFYGIQSVPGGSTTAIAVPSPAAIAKSKTARAQPNATGCAPGCSCPPAIRRGQ